jgi:hypothetical protein
VRAVAKGDRTAFDRLFRLYHARIYKFSIRMLQDHLSAEEVACDTLYAVWTSASTFLEQSEVSSWILGIAYRRSLKSVFATLVCKPNALEKLGQQIDIETKTDGFYAIVFRDPIGVSELSNVITVLENKTKIKRVEILH